MIAGSLRWPAHARRRLCALLCIGLMCWGAHPAFAAGPLRVSKINPRYFADDSGRPIYLAGSHNWHDFVDNGHREPRSENPPHAFDYEGYLDFLQSHNHNFFRLWRWEVPKWADAQPRGMIKYCSEHPWLRTGPGVALDGEPRFNLQAFDQSYFDRMRARVVEAGSRNIYVSVMLFEGWAAQFTDAWRYHPFAAGNNVNGIAADFQQYYDGAEHRMSRLLPGFLRSIVEGSEMARITELQRAYVRKVIDTVNDLDNVLYEICNESDEFSIDWQFDLIRYVKQYEAAKPKRHPVGMTIPAQTVNAAVFYSPADWISPNAWTCRDQYRDNPSPAYRGRVIVNDTDHLWGHTGGDAVWVWKSFTRGLNVLFMEELTASPTWQDSARDAIGQTRRWSQAIDLAHMIPSAVSETGYCLADPGKEYLVFQPGDKGEFFIDLRNVRGGFTAEWFDVNRNLMLPAPPAQAGKKLTFTTPFAGPAVLHLKRRASA